MSGAEDNPGGPVPPSTDTLQSLSERLNRGSLKSSGRILILILLAMNKKSTAKELRALTGFGKGSLENHLEKLESAGYVRTRNVKSFGGWRQTVEVTEEGLKECRELLLAIRTLDV